MTPINRRPRPGYGGQDLGLGQGPLQQPPPQAQAQAPQRQLSRGGYDQNVLARQNAIQRAAQPRPTRGPGGMGLARGGPALQQYRPQMGQSLQQYRSPINPVDFQRRSVTPQPSSDFVQMSPDLGPAQQVPAQGPAQGPYGQIPPAAQARMDAMQRRALYEF